MSQLDYPPFDGNELQSFIDPQRWKDFVQIVLEVTVQAYRDLFEKGIAKIKWEEDHFTVNLEKCIRPLAFKRGIFVLSQTKTYTVEIETGEVTAREAKILDIRMWSMWENYDKVHFVWECKRIANGRENKGYKDLVPEYVKEGMLRFLDEEYAIGLDDAGILAYVLCGDIPSIVLNINKSMQSSRRKRPLTISDHLQLVSPIDAFEHVYLSCHERPSGTSKITLHHLFLSFDFDKGN